MGAIAGMARSYKGLALLQLWILCPNRAFNRGNSLEFLFSFVEFLSQAAIFCLNAFQPRTSRCFLRLCGA